MSMNGNINGGLQSPTCVRLTTTGQTDIYAATTSTRTTVSSISLVNETAGAVIVLLDYYDLTNNHKVYRTEVPLNGTVVVTDLPILLKEAGEKIKATAASANAITVTLFLVQDIGRLGG